MLNNMRHSHKEIIPQQKRKKKPITEAEEIIETKRTIFTRYIYNLTIFFTENKIKKHNRNTEGFKRN